MITKTSQNIKNKYSFSLHYHQRQLYECITFGLPFLVSICSSFLQIAHIISSFLNIFLLLLQEFNKYMSFHDILSKLTSLSISLILHELIPISSIIPNVIMCGCEWVLVVSIWLCRVVVNPIMEPWLISLSHKYVP